MRLLLMRHAEAVPGRDDDPGRPLTPRALQRLSQMDAEVRDQLTGLTHILCSPWLRARETVMGLKAQFPLSPDITFSEALTPSGDINQVLSLLEGVCSAESVVLVVTHQPLMGRLASLLCEGSRVSVFSPAPAELAVIEQDWPAAGVGVLRGWYRL